MPPQMSDKLKVHRVDEAEEDVVHEVEQEEIENKPFATLTLKRKKDGDKERDAKMEQLKKKLRTFFFFKLMSCNSRLVDDNFN